MDNHSSIHGKKSFMLILRIISTKIYRMHLHPMQNLARLSYFATCLEKVIFSALKDGLAVQK